MGIRKIVNILLWVFGSPEESKNGGLRPEGMRLFITPASRILNFISHYLKYDESLIETDDEPRLHSSNRSNKRLGIDCEAATLLGWEVRGWHRHHFGVSFASLGLEGKKLFITLTSRTLTFISPFSKCDESPIATGMSRFIGNESSVAQ